MDGKACCSPGREGAAPAGPAAAFARVTGGATAGMKLIPGGEFLMGNERDYGFPADGEGPVHAVRLGKCHVCCRLPPAADAS